MNFNLAITPQIWLSLTTVLLLLALSAYSWHRRAVPGAMPFAIGSLFSVLWMTGYLMEYAAADLATKIFWYKFHVAWQLPTNTAIFCFVLEYTWPGRWLTRRKLVLLSILPLLCFGLILTDHIHHLMWTQFIVDGTISAVSTPAGWFFIAYSYSLSLLEFVAFIWLFIRSPQHRWPAVVMITGISAARVIYLLDAAQIIQVGPLIDELIVPFVFLTYVIGLFGFRVFDPIPLARQTAIQQMPVGMIVLDPSDRVASLNPYAERILGAPARQNIGKSVRGLLPAYPGDLGIDPGGVEIEFSPGIGQEFGGHSTIAFSGRHYTLAISQLKDWRGLKAGHLLLLRDVTEEKLAQTQVLEQQRAVVMLQERERLARELHDSTGQVLGYVSMQTQAITNWVREGDLAMAEDQLVRLTRVAQDAHADLRASILNLRSVMQESWSFLAALKQNLASCQENYGISPELFIPTGFTDQDFPPGIGEQLLRVVQEALTNVHKHAQASSVQVILYREGRQITIVIADDGCGFDLEVQPPAGVGHFGLAIMGERMAQVNGSVAIRSKPGAGTEVTLRVPIPR